MAQNQKPTTLVGDILDDLIEAPFRGVGMIRRSAKRGKDNPILAEFKALAGQLVAVAAGVTAAKMGLESLASDPQTLPTFIKAGAMIVGGILGGNVPPVLMAYSNRLDFRMGIQQRRIDKDKPPEAYGYSSERDFIAWPKLWARRPPDNPPGPPRNEPWWYP